MFCLFIRKTSSLGNLMSHRFNLVVTWPSVCTSRSTNQCEIACFERHLTISTPILEKRKLKKKTNKQTSNFYKRPNEKHVWACAFLFISTVNLCVNTISHFYRYCLFTFYAFSKSSKLLTITRFTWKFSDGVFPLSQHFDDIIFVLVLALHDTNFWDRLAKVWSKRRWSIHN